MRISDWSSDVCSSDLLQNREIGCDITTDQLRLIFLTIGQDDSDAVNHGSGRAAGYNMGVRDDVAVSGYDEAGAQRLRFTGLRLSRKAKQAAERRSGEGILDHNMLAGGYINSCGQNTFKHIGKSGLAR